MASLDGPGKIVYSAVSISVHVQGNEQLPGNAPAQAVTGIGAGLIPAFAIGTAGSCRAAGEGRGRRPVPGVTGGLTPGRHPGCTWQTQLSVIL